MLHKKRFAAVVASTAALSLATAGMALADQFTNTVDTTIDGTVEQMALNAHGVAKTTTVYLHSTGGNGANNADADTNNGCNISGNSTSGNASYTSVTVSLSSSDSAIASVSPSSITFTGCDAPATVTVTPGNAGTAHITGAVTATTGSNGSGNLDTSGIAFDAVVTGATNTAPTVTVTGVTAGASYSKGSVPTAMCQVTDAEDGNSSFAATLSDITGAYASDGIGSQEASCSYTDLGGLTASSSAVYSIVDPTAPGISYTLNPSPADGSNGWYKSAVALTWTVTEAESPNSLSKTGCVNQTVTADQTEQTYSCSATSAGGSTSTVSVTIKKDGTAPAGSCDAGPTGWQAANVTLSCTSSDATSGLASSGDASFSLSTAVAAGDETGNALTGSKTVNDIAGNSTTFGPYSFMVDRKAPVVTAGTPSCSVAGTNGWCRGTVTVPFTAVDGGSGLADATQASFSQATSGDGAGQMVGSGNVADNVGNVGSASAGPFDVDATAPTAPQFATGSGLFADGGYYFPNSTLAQPGCTATDATSGMASCTVADSLATPTTVGTHTLTATATDNAGNTSTSTLTYTIYTLTKSGFFAPVDMNGVVNTVKAGSTVPLKFTVTDNGAVRTDTAVVTAFGAKQYACGTTAPEDAIEMTTTGGTSLRYDTTGAQFIQNWQTPKAAGTCYVATATFVDGSKLSALFKLK